MTEFNGDILIDEHPLVCFKDIFKLEKLGHNSCKPSIAYIAQAISSGFSFTLLIAGRDTRYDRAKGQLDQLSPGDAKDEGTRGGLGQHLSVGKDE